MPIASDGRVPRGLTNRSPLTARRHRSVDPLHYRSGRWTRRRTTRSSRSSGGSSSAACPISSNGPTTKRSTVPGTGRCPSSSVAYLLLGLNALDLEHWSLAQNLLATLFVVATLRRDLGGVEPAATPAVVRPTAADRPRRAGRCSSSARRSRCSPSASSSMRSRRSLLGAALLALIYLWSSYGVGPMLRWGAQRGRGQLTGLGPLVARALPLLLLFTTFLFINAEVWQVAGALDGLPYVLVIAIFFGLGATFVLTRRARLHPPGEPVRHVGRDRRATSPTRRRRRSGCRPTSRWSIR